MILLTSSLLLAACGNNGDSSKDSSNKSNNDSGNKAELKEATKNMKIHRQTIRRVLKRNTTICRCY